MREPEENIDITPIRTEILNYVSRVRPLLTDEAKSMFMKMWEDILALPAVESKVYKPGKQWGTNFAFVNWPLPGTPLEMWEQMYGNPGYLVSYTMAFVLIEAALFFPWRQKRRS